MTQRSTVDAVPHPAGIIALPLTAPAPNPMPLPYTIRVVRTSDTSFRVTVDDGNGQTVHDVTATTADIARYAPGVNAERLLTTSFEFLLQREPKESILRRFDLPVIERYFPEYPVAMRRTVTQG